MSFEVTFSYHERVEPGRYNTGEIKEFKKRVGQPYEDVPLEKLASVVLSQLARRDIMVADVKIFEYARKEIVFKETPDGSGIVIKNRKFSPGGVQVEDVGEDAPKPQAPPPQPVAAHQAPPQVPQSPRPPSVPATLPERPIAVMVFDPEIPLLHEAQKKGLRFTPNKKYVVFKQESLPMGMGQVLTMKDDLQRTVRVADKYFVAAHQVRLVGDDEVEGGFSSNAVKQKTPKLLYESEVEDDMPDLRPNFKLR